MPNDPSIAIAVLYERLGHVIEKMDLLSAKIDRQSAHRDHIMSDMERRVESIEQEFSKTKWFLAGLATGGGLLGGAVASMFTKMLG
jgi:hypothetical protein